MSGSCSLTVFFVPIVNVPLFSIALLAVIYPPVISNVAFAWLTIPPVIWVSSTVPLIFTYPEASLFFTVPLIFPSVIVIVPVD